MALLITGCASLQQPQARLEASVEAQVEPLKEAVIGLSNDVNRVEQQLGEGASFNDTWTLRLLAGGAVITVTAYPIGKVLWMMGIGVVKRRSGNNGSDQGYAR